MYSSATMALNLDGSCVPVSCRCFFFLLFFFSFLLYKIDNKKKDSDSDIVRNAAVASHQAWPSSLVFGPDESKAHNDTDVIWRQSC